MAKREERPTAIVLHADLDLGGAVGVGNAGGLRGVYGKDDVGGWVVGWACGNAEHVFLCHCKVEPQGCWASRSRMCSTDSHAILRFTFVLL